MDRSSPEIGDWWISDYFDGDMVVVHGVTDSVVYVMNIYEQHSVFTPCGASYPVARSWFMSRYRLLTKLEKYLNGLV